MGIFMKEWESLYASKSGERGIFSRPAAQRTAERSGRRDPTAEFGTNPCSEIILRPGQFCNLTEVVVRSEDTLKDLKRKVRLATILGTIQATLTDFRYLRPHWKRNTEEEALLGVSLTGIMDHEVLSDSFTKLDKDPNMLKRWLRDLKEVAIETNAEWANILGINPAAGITCVKPSGTVSQLVDSSSGIHPRYSRYYIRTVRADKKDPLAQFMVDAGFPVEDDVTKPDYNYVFSFPIEAPKSSVFRDDRTAIEQLELWKVYAEEWCEHKPSITVYVKEHEWMAVGAWVYENFDICSGVSFLPHSNHTYRQAPYQEIDRNTYKNLCKAMPSNVDWSGVAAYEQTDNTIGSQELACVGGACEL
jgi:ribonucleoside-diphosphate reductase alpha chain